MKTRSRFKSAIWRAFFIPIGRTISRNYRRAWQIANARLRQTRIRRTRRLVAYLALEALDENRILLCGAARWAHKFLERILNAAREASSWLTYSGSYDAQRYSTLNQITLRRVGRLRVEWMYQVARATK
jgi:hypothetical protein